MKQLCCKCGVIYGIKEPITDSSYTHGFCPDCLMEQGVVEFLSSSLKISTKHEGNKIKISLILDGNEISSDFIDYDKGCTCRSIGK